MLRFAINEAVSHSGGALSPFTGDIHLVSIADSAGSIVARMEVHGFPVDVTKMREMREAVDTNAATLASGIRADFGDQRLNPGSPRQLVEAFKATGVEIEDNSEETLRALNDPRAQKILLWREKTKLCGIIKGLLDSESGGPIHHQGVAGFSALAVFASATHFRGRPDPSIHPRIIGDSDKPRESA